jgi:hypothetical protein
VIHPAIVAVPFIWTLLVVLIIGSIAMPLTLSLVLP